MPGQRRFQVIELFRQDTFHQISGDGLLASMVADVQRERQVQLNLQRGAELGGQEVDCVRGQNGGVNRTKGRVEHWRGGRRDGELLLTGGFRHVPVPQSAP